MRQTDLKREQEAAPFGAPLSTRTTSMTYIDPSRKRKVMLDMANGNGNGNGNRDLFSDIDGARSSSISTPSNKQATSMDEMSGDQNNIEFRKLLEDMSAREERVNISQPRMEKKCLMDEGDDEGLKDEDFQQVEEKNREREIGKAEDEEFEDEEKEASNDFYNEEERNIDQIENERDEDEEAKDDEEQEDEEEEEEEDEEDDSYDEEGGDVTEGMSPQMFTRTVHVKRGRRLDTEEYASSATKHKSIHTFTEKVQLVKNVSASGGEKGEEHIEHESSEKKEEMNSRTNTLKTKKQKYTYRYREDKNAPRRGRDSNDQPNTMNEQNVKSKMDNGSGRVDRSQEGKRASVTFDTPSPQKRKRSSNDENIEDEQEKGERKVVLEGHNIIGNRRVTSKGND
tara:strand:- start:2720 stop:3910 length:1191 start_codon:yes stop_codon:yes gene_type:complete